MIRAAWSYIPILLAALAGGAAAPAGPVELPRPDYTNSFCMFPIDETWHVRTPQDRARLTKMVEDMRRILGPERLYARLGVAVISNAGEDQTFALARELGIGLVLQGGAADHHSEGWGFLQQMHDANWADRRNFQWFQDGRVTDNPTNQWVGVRACSSRYAKAVHELRQQREVARAKQVAEAMRKFPDVILGVSGPIECEINHREPNLWGDYSPFTVAEFRDYLTHRGLYAPGAERAGQGWPGGERFADDPSPAEARGNHSSFNQVFGTQFTTWSLRYWDLEKFPQRLPLDAPGLPGPGATGYIEGGFDAPRTPSSARLWEAWASLADNTPGFRSKLVNFWVRDHTRWLAEAGLPREKIYSHQIPAESVSPTRLSGGASAVWTADTAHGSIGITTYYNAAHDEDVFQKVARRNPNWGIFEYHPHPIDCAKATVDECLSSLYSCLRYRAHILTPINWPGEGKDFLVSTGPLADAIKQFMAALPDQPYYNRTYVDYILPPVSDVKIEKLSGKTRVTWSPKIWPDLRYTWSDWREFQEFEVRNWLGRRIGTTSGTEVEIVGHPWGIHIAAVKRATKPQLPVVRGLRGYHGWLSWNASYDFFFDHYRVEIFGSADDATPLQTLSVQKTGVDLPPPPDRREVWCRVAACDAADVAGPFTERFRLSLPRAGKRLVDFSAQHPTVSNSPDTRWREMAVGSDALPGLFQHPPGGAAEWARAEYQCQLPSVAGGQRLLLVAEVGVADGGGPGDGVVLRVEIQGQKKFEQLVPTDKHWHPIEVDVSGFSGQRVQVTLLCNPNKNAGGDWAMWGAPQILLVEQP